MSNKTIRERHDIADNGPPKHYVRNGSGEAVELVVKTDTDRGRSLALGKLHPDLSKDDRRRIVKDRTEVGADGPGDVLDKAIQATEQQPEMEYSKMQATAQTMMDHHHFATEGEETLFIFDGGVYRPVLNSELQRLTKPCAAENGCHDKVTIRFVKEVRADIINASSEIWKAPPGDKINLRNGYWNVKEGKFIKGHDPAFLSTVQVPIEYKPRSKCPEIDRFFKELLTKDLRHVVIQFLAACLMPGIAELRGLFIIGAPGTGKTRLLEVMKAFVGDINVTVVPLKALGQRFGGQQLPGKLLCTAGEVDGEAIRNSDVFKGATGGEPVRLDIKHKPDLKVRLICKFLYGSNVIPTIRGADQSIFDRILPFELQNDFRNSDDNIPAHVLDRKLQAPAELEGLLLRVLRETKNVYTHGRIDLCPQCQETLDEMRTSTGAFEQWLESSTTTSPTAKIDTVDLRDSYRRDCERRGESPVTATVFGKLLLQARPNVKASHRRATKTEKDQGTTTNQIRQYGGITVLKGIDPVLDRKQEARRCGTVDSKSIRKSIESKS